MCPPASVQLPRPANEFANAVVATETPGDVINFKIKDTPVRIFGGGDVLDFCFVADLLRIAASLGIKLPPKLDIHLNAKKEIEEHAKKYGGVLGMEPSGFAVLESNELFICPSLSLLEESDGSLSPFSADVLTHEICHLLRLSNGADYSFASATTTSRYDASRNMYVPDRNTTCFVYSNDPTSVLTETSRYDARDESVLETSTETPSISFYKDNDEGLTTALAHAFVVKLAERGATWPGIKASEFWDMLEIGLEELLLNNDQKRYVIPGFKTSRLAVMLADGDESK